jgi:uncharacterized phage-associated protein
MSAPYSPKAIANAFLQRAFNAKKLIGHLKLQKLVYIAHGYYLAFTNGVPLVNEPFEAWDYGPVSRSLYDEFRSVGRDQITRLAMEIDWDNEGDIPTPAPVGDTTVEQVIDFVFKAYGDRTPFALSDLTHKDGWAWDRARKADKYQLRNKDIDNELIKEDFKPYLKNTE